MRDQGRLTNWNDDKGFGFVTPDEGGLKAFVHIRAFSYRHRRPREGDVITYQLAWDKEGRPRAENVLFRELPKAKPDPAPEGLLGASLFATAFLAAIITLTALAKIPWPVPLVYLAVSLLTFCVYAFDKSAAMNRRRRTSERALHILSFLGGWPGALIAQRLFFHKTKKQSFQADFWVIVGVHLIVVCGLVAGVIPVAVFHL